MSHPTPQNGNHRTPRLQNVKYSLAELLAEVELEKVSGGLGQEKVSQAEITKAFQQQTHRRRVAPSN